MMSEDQIRDKARDILGLRDSADADSGVGQLTSFGQLGFKGEGAACRPDGWWLPKDTTVPALVLEVKAEKVDFQEKHVQELLRNCRIASTRYRHVCGILYNGVDIRVFKDEVEIDDLPELASKEHYIGLFSHNFIDKNRIYELTRRINNCLHTEFGVKNLYHRMIFTACALVAERYGADLTRVKGLGWDTFHTRIHSVLAKSLEKDRQKNGKIGVLLDVYSDIRMNTTEKQTAIDNFVDWIREISDSINSDWWRGEDVMGIFFNEFNRYKKKSEAGQVFTPEHITDFMYRLIDVDKTDRVLDAACGSGGFLVKAMSNMIREAGGVGTPEARKIKAEHLYGIEFDREIYALACANMLIHKDGKTNLEQMDSRSPEACRWIQEKAISKVLMNPPFESKYGCLEIVGNVLDSVPEDTLCAFILADKKLEKEGKGTVRRMLKRHTLQTIVKLPEDLFFGVGVTASAFVFRTGKPQGEDEIFTCWMKDDGLETVKNQGRHDLKGRWAEIEDYWLDVVRKRTDTRYHTAQWMKPDLQTCTRLSYPAPSVPIVVHANDFSRTALDWQMFRRGIDAATLRARMLELALYTGSIRGDGRVVTMSIPGNVRGDAMDEEPIDMSSWRSFAIGNLFEILKGTRLTKADMIPGDINFIGASAMNNGITHRIGNEEAIHPGHVITVNYNGSIGAAFWQEERFWASDDVNILRPRFSPMSRETAMFFLPLLRKAGMGHDFKDKWKKEDMERDKIPLPADPSGNPDYAFMERYMTNVLKRMDTRLNLMLAVCELPETACPPAD